MMVGVVAVEWRRGVRRKRKRLGPGRARTTETRPDNSTPDKSSAVSGHAYGCYC